MNDSQDFIKSLGEPILPLTPMQKAEKFVRIKELKERVEQEYDTLRADLLEETRRNGVVSLKTEQYTISRVKRVNLKIINHQAAINSFTEKDIPVTTKVVIDEEYMKPVLDGIKKSGEFVPGIETNEIEYVTVRVNK